ncbi:MAG TPA: tripartite tricarboxylate transporter substrate-binding protein [Pseudolabrys sp.]|nr:tripartite tricarboxylate transporter substrate-binding protein [Pseudolabrys sp.]
MNKLLPAVALAMAVGLASTAHADNYPSRKIIMVAPLGVGGSTDIIGRIMADAMGKQLGQTIVVENTTGAGGTIGEGRVANAAPDGYTIAVGQWGTNVANGAIYKLNYDLMKDFEPIGLIATQPFFVAARKDMPANNLKEFVAWLKANGDKTNEGHSGVGTPSHVAGLLLQKAIGTKWAMVPYRGAGEASQALLAGQIDLLLVTPAVGAAQMKAGQIKVYAVTAPQRINTSPDVPTTDEAGLPGYHFSFWHALWAPKGTPQPIIAKLNEALRKSLADPATRKRLIDLAQDIFPPDQQSPEALRKFQQAEIDKWWPIIKAAGIKAQ